MSQEDWIVLAFKIVEVASVVTIVFFVACYSRWAHWQSNAIGRTLVFKDIALVLVLIPSILSIFINFSRFTSRIAGWFDIGAFALVPVIMVWRTWVFWKIHKAGQMPQDPAPPGPPEGE